MKTPTDKQVDRLLVALNADLKATADADEGPGGDDECMCEFPVECDGSGFVECDGCGGDFCVCGVCGGNGAGECDGCRNCDDENDHDDHDDGDE